VEGDLETGGKIYRCQILHAVALAAVERGGLKDEGLDARDGAHYYEDTGAYLLSLANLNTIVGFGARTASARCALPTTTRSSTKRRHRLGRVQHDAR
jgi:hypothetical protein